MSDERIRSRMLRILLLLSVIAMIAGVVRCSGELNRSTSAGERGEQAE